MRRKHIESPAISLSWISQPSHVMFAQAGHGRWFHFSRTRQDRQNGTIFVEHHYATLRLWRFVWNVAWEVWPAWGGAST